ncbi:hypothetical protein JCGZ_07310 [Jatropha curcas]|uniref:RING-type E3 ubiquitin transferase n=1 Tax=Jatropha curcas TaxID=180498 RepID=A0A067KPM6_JATCU|nr:hypothetical protein JCGZ_07310 [Jatropha curcas]
MASTSFDLDEALSSLTLDMAVNISFDLHETPSGTDNLSRRSRITAASSINDLIAGMPTVSTNDEVCIVCMEGFRSSVGGKRIPCGHIYHSDCISSWLCRSNSCPLCRINISDG